MPHKNHGRKEKWRRIVVALARMQGDTRPRGIIINEKEVRRNAISLAFSECESNRERAEKIVALGHHYPAAGLNEGEVLTQTLQYEHPALKPS